jgi:4-amino-4-deoxy-L-arabinose transferase-like glycosyltransferase
LNPKSRNFKEQILPVILIVLSLALFVAKAATSLVQESSTFDETSYFGLGKYLLQNRRWDVPGSISHPPLSYCLAGIPLLFCSTDEKLWQYDPALKRDREFLGDNDIFRGQALLASPANQGDLMLDWSRLMIVLTAVLLGGFVCWWSHLLYGKWSAILAAVLFSFSPNILAHARLITPDLTLTTFFFITVYFFWRLLKEGQTGGAVLAGISLGLALLSKFPSLLLFPICFALLILWRMKCRGPGLRPCLIFVLLGVGILCLGFEMNLKPYFDGIRYQYEHGSSGRRSFLMGQLSNQGWWYYFIVVFLVKTPVATMIFLAVAAALFIGKARQGQWIDEAFLLVPAAVVFCFFSLSNRAMGLRYILPVYPFLFVFASGAARAFLSNRKGIGLCAGLVAWYVGASCWIHPHYLAYFNELVGGPDNGYEYLVDSNLDWGQDLKGLKKYMDEHGISKINLSYFGTDSPERYGISYNWLPSFYLRDPDPQHHESVLKGWVAISATNLQGAYFDKDIFAWFRGRKPVAKIGYSIFIYKMDG